MLLDRVNPFLFRSLITKTILSLKFFEIPGIQFIQIEWSICFTTKKARDILFLIANCNVICYTINNIIINTPEIWYSYIVIRVPDIIRSFTSIILMNEIIIKEKLVIQIDIILIKMHCCPSVGLEIIYIISFTKEIRVFVFFGLLTFFKEIQPQRKKILYNPGYQQHCNPAK